MNAQLPTPKTSKVTSEVGFSVGSAASSLGSFGSWALGIDWELGVAELRS
jgi:hypothetical protein